MKKINGCLASTSIEREVSTTIPNIVLEAFQVMDVTETPWGGCVMRTIQKALYVAAFPTMLEAMTDADGLSEDKARETVKEAVAVLEHLEMDAAAVKTALKKICRLY